MKCSDDRWFGWSFLPADRRLQYGDGSGPIPLRAARCGSEDKPLALCKYGLHASPTVIDALSCVSGPILCRVELIGPRLDRGDKSVAYQRRVIAWADADSMLRLWACWCVRQVWHLLTDKRSRKAVIIAERYARGQDTDAWAAASAAAGFAFWAAWAASSAAAGSASWAAWVAAVAAQTKEA